MAIKLYDASVSTNTKRVAVVLREKNIPFEFHNVDFRNGAHKAPEYVVHQPFGLMPYIVTDDGFELYESRAIMRFLQDAFPNQGAALIPADAKGRAKYEQVASVEVSNFDAYAQQIIAEVIFKPMFGKATDEARVAALKNDWEPKLNAYEAILSKQRYPAGNEITLADLAHLPNGTLITNAVKLDYLIDATKRPNIARWWADISNRASWKAVKDGVTGTV